MFFKKTALFFILFISLFLFSLSPVSAQSENGSTAVEFNPLCWTKQGCAEARKAFNTEDYQSGWIDDETVCKGHEWGYCLPAGSTITSIAFGGKKEFLHIGDYIQTVYKYGVGAASVLAVFVILLAGVEWTSSGGNSEVIARSRKRIVGSVLGLIIAYSSYFILSTINPELTNLRLPQVYMVRPQQILPELCSDLKENTPLALAAPYTDQVSKVSPSGLTKYEFSYKDAKDKGQLKDWFYCGKRFFMEGGGNITCFADQCGSGAICALLGDSEKEKTPNRKYGCKKGNLSGKVVCAKGAGLTATNECEGWEFPDLVGTNDIWLQALCQDGDSSDVNAATETNQLTDAVSFTLAYSLADIDDVVKKCDGKLAGFVLRVEMNENYDITDEIHWIGKEGIDLGDPDFFTIERIIYKWNTKIDPKYFFSEQEIRGGFSGLTINAAKVHDIDTFTLEDAEKYYNPLLK